MSKNKITHKRKCHLLKIYIDGIIHLYIQLEDLVMFQSWVHGEKEFYIEYSYASGAKIVSGYTDKNRWGNILRVLDTELKGT